MRSQSNIIIQLTTLARRIREPRTTVGYSAFILFALAKRCRPIIWEGETPVDLIHCYVPWACGHCKHKCSVDAVACAMEAHSGGHAVMKPRTPAHPLHETRHWIAATPFYGALETSGDSIQAFYHRLGRVLLGSVTDNDCGVDT